MRAMQRIGPISSIKLVFQTCSIGDTQSRNGWYLAENASQHADLGYSSERLRMWDADGRARCLTASSAWRCRLEFFYRSRRNRKLLCRLQILEVRLAALHPPPHQQLRPDWGCALMACCSMLSSKRMASVSRSIMPA